MMASARGAAFRGDINGLRAWAVVAVVLYHFGVAGFGGGFVGVDVFFVISGYLMTGIVARGLARGDFSLIDFYLARAKRIVPALAVLCAVLMAAGWWVLLPPDYQMLASHAIYSLAFLSNVEYWQEAGYFDVASHEKWLLHTWSLAVEWQFYLLLPLALLAVWRVLPGRRAQTWAVLLGAAASLAAAVALSGAYPTMSFYLLPTRAWEMLAGGLVFLGIGAGTIPAAWRRWVELAGLGLIVVAVAGFDLHSVWPGWRACVPVAGAMLVLTADRASRWTGNAAAQWLGERSYSIYLWHWPVVVALAYVEHADDALGISAGLALTLVLGHLSFVLVENSTRRRLSAWRRPLALAGLATLALCAALPAFGVWKLHGVTGRFGDKVERVAAEGANFNPRRTSCHLKVGVTPPSCVYGGSQWKVLVAGDSHASALISGLAAAAPVPAEAGVVQWTYSGCAFVPGMIKTPAALAAQEGDYRCAEFLAWTDGALAQADPALPLVIMGRYAQAARGPNEDHLRIDTPEVYFSNIYPQTSPAFLAEFGRHITESACQLAKRRTVYMVRPTPEMGVDVPRTLSRRMAMGIQGDISIPLAEYQRRNAWVWAAQDAAREQCGIRILDPTAYLCHDGRCFGSRDGFPLYVDDDHLSESGNKLLVPMFAEVFKRHAVAAHDHAGRPAGTPGGG